MARYDIVIRDAEIHDVVGLTATPWGQGDTPIKEVLQLLKRERRPIPADIEYEYRGTGTSPEEVKKCYEYARQALA